MPDRRQRNIGPGPHRPERRRSSKDHRRFSEPWMRFLSMPVHVFIRRTCEEAVELFR